MPDGGEARVALVQVLHLPARRLEEVRVDPLALRDAVGALEVPVAGARLVGDAPGPVEEPVHDEEVLAQPPLGEPDALEEAPPVELAPRAHVEEPVVVHLGDGVGEIERAGRALPRLLDDRAVVEDIGDSAHREVAAEGDGGTQEPLVHERLDEVVAVDEADPIAARDVDARVPSRREAAVRLVDDPDARVPRRVPVANRGAAVRGPVVDDDDLEVAMGLGEHAVEAAREVDLDVVDGDDDGDEGACGRAPNRIHHRAPSPAGSGSPAATRP